MIGQYVLQHRYAGVILSGVEGSRGITLDFATGFLDFARNDNRFNF